MWTWAYVYVYTPRDVHKTPADLLREIRPGGLYLWYSAGYCARVLRTMPAHACILKGVYEVNHLVYIHMRIRF